MRSVLFLSDSVNRRFLRLYEESGMCLPNIERLALRSAVFENHWTGSAPCMPARRDLMTGRYNFLERSWGPIEAFDHTLPQVLRTAGVWSHMVTDHYHYMEIGGENYCQMFDSWILHRGQEWDPCVSRTRPLDIPEHYGKIVPQYWYNRTQFAQDETQYPSAKTITEAAQWLEENHDSDNFLLWIEAFDPHEPFDVPQRFLDMVGDDYSDKLFLWPEYKQADRAGLTNEALRHINKRYMALLLMTDHYLGKVLDVMDRYDMWKDTAFLYTTDHGYMLGEHDYLAKNYMPAYNEVFHIPLLVHLPGDVGAGERIQALTQNIDVMPTLLELYGVDSGACRNPMHGKSWLPLLRGEAEKLRDCVLYGYFGKQVNLTDGRYTYFRSPNKENRPLNVYTTIPTDIRRYFDAERLDPTKLTCGRFLSWTRYPVYSIPADAVFDNDDGTLRFIYLYDWEQEDQLYDLEEDYAQQTNLIQSRPDQVRRLAEMMRRAMEEYDAPREQFQRMRFCDEEGLEP